MISAFGVDHGELISKRLCKCKCGCSQCDSSRNKVSKGKCTCGCPKCNCSTKMSKRKPKLGSGKRFAQLKGKLADKGASDPGALAAYIGRKKYGNKKFAALGRHGKH